MAPKSSEAKKNMVRDTSTTAYLELLESGKLSRMQGLVYRTIYRNPDRTDKEIAQLLAKEINTITPRRGELEEMGLVHDTGIRACRITRNNAHTWAVTPMADDSKIIKNTQRRKYTKTCPHCGNTI